MATATRPQPTGSAIATQSAHALAQGMGGSWTPEQVELLVNTVAKGATADEFKVFLMVCQRTGLDPFARQIYLVKRYDKKLNRDVATSQTSIDGFRLIADRSGRMDGSEVYWCAKDGVWRDVWLQDEPPAAAKVIVYKQGCSRGFPAIARFDEYVQTDKYNKATYMWAKMPANQLAKCAESLALRKAFPAETSGIYTREEMQQADVDPVTVHAVDTTNAPALPADADGDFLQRAAQSKLKAQGLTGEGFQSFFRDVAPEAKGLGQVPEDVLQFIAEKGMPASAIDNWNKGLTRAEAKQLNDAPMQSQQQAPAAPVADTKPAGTEAPLPDDLIGLEDEDQPIGW